MWKLISAAYRGIKHYMEAHQRAYMDKRYGEITSVAYGAISMGVYG